MSAVPLTWLFWANVWAFVAELIVAVLLYRRFGSTRPNRTLVPTLAWIDVPAGYPRLLIGGLTTGRSVLALAYLGAFMLVHGYVRGVYFIELWKRGLSVYG